MTKCLQRDISGNDLVLKENIKKALAKVDNLAYVTALSDNCMGEFPFDFIVDLYGSKFYSITGVCDDSEFLSSDKIKKIISDSNSAKRSDDFFSFFIVTNSKVRPEDKETLECNGLKIEYNEGEVTCEDLYNSIKTHHEKCLIESKNAQP
ncbi:MAG: hypothetical protein KJ804_03065 [Proteobacteria bacterium]|nr:hypothetical protein [Pseudomonadota bacterium]